MPRANAQFRVSIKDKKLGTHLKVELIEDPGMWGERRFRLRVNGKEPKVLKEATLTEIFDRLRRWLVTQSDREKPKPAVARQG
jgi:hypothetical protein